MEREELLTLLYTARSFFDRAEELREKHNSLLQAYKSEIPYENTKEHIAYRPYLEAPGNVKESKKWKGISGFFKTLGIWILVFICMMFSLTIHGTNYLHTLMGWILTFLYHHGVTEIEEAYKVLDGKVIANWYFGGSKPQYWWSFLDLYIILVICTLVTILLKFFINAMINRKNNQMKERIVAVAAKNRLIQEENQLLEQKNRNIDNYNASLVQKNSEIDKYNEQIREHNQNVNRKLDEINGQMLVLWKEMNDFVEKDLFPKEDFQLEAIEFYIREVENHRCDSIKECAKAYVEAKRDYQTRVFQNDLRISMDEQIQIGREQVEIRREQVEVGRAQVEIGREQIQWQKMHAFLQMEQIAQSWYNTRTVTNAVNQNTEAANRMVDEVKKNTKAANSVVDEIKKKYYGS